MQHSIHLFICITLLLSSPNFPFSEQQKSTLEHIVRTADPDVNIGIYITSPDTPQVSYTQNIDRLFAPASNIKLFTAAAALHNLGSEFRFKTSLITDGYQKDNSLSGNLYLKASGDPSLTLLNLEELFAQLKNAGITTIKGDVCIDLSIFDDYYAQYFAKGFCMDDLGAVWNPPTTALIINHNTLTLPYGKTTISHMDFHKYILFIIQNLLTKFNIDCCGATRLSSAQNQTMHELAQHHSKPLKELIAHMLKVSDNLYANAILKRLGFHESGTPGTWENGKQAVKNFLDTCVGINSDSLVLEDGAGLSRYNLISPRQIVTLLTWIYKQPHLFDTFLECLPAAGIDGTLKDRLINIPGIIRAKTGTLGDASSISGYLCIEDHSPLIFSILINNFIRHKACEQKKEKQINYKTDIEDKLCTYLVKCVKEEA